MGFFGRIFDSIFAPPGVNDASSAISDIDHSRVFESTPGMDTFRHDDTVFNPTTGLPMVGGIGSIDVGGHTWCETPSIHESMSTGCGISHWEP